MACCRAQGNFACGHPRSVTLISHSRPTANEANGLHHSADLRHRQWNGTAPEPTRWTQRQSRSAPASAAAAVFSRPCQLV